jgi:hypothetical protein
LKNSNKKKWKNSKKYLKSEKYKKLPMMVKKQEYQNPSKDIT